uniref:NADH-ubiquinone oxidoreductase chain 3 n=1 Tax=Scolytinae sp. BMNH 1040146 TaxID=1903785 RepID=A0A343A560_9CUCU|nr:NADH dehydrogenase subunit 3 [Scolytinae sp. BMNH 1040146]
MKMMMLYVFITLMISLIMIIMLNLIAKKTFYDREKMSPFECGFDPKNLARMPFSLQFFLIAIIFVIFDVELTLFIPLILILKSSSMIHMSITIMIFLMLLIFGIFHEQSQGSLNWIK